jgi:hypothetical protein
MKWTPLLMILTLAAAMASFGDAVSAASDTNTVQGLQLYLTAANTSYTNGEPIVIHSLLTNSTELPQKVTPCHFRANLTFEVTDTNDVAVPVIDDGLGVSISGPGEYLLPAHGSQTGEMSIERYYNLKPGVYRIRAKWVFGADPPQQRPVLCSDVLTITIKEAAKK